MDIHNDMHAEQIRIVTPRQKPKKVAVGNDTQRDTVEIDPGKLRQAARVREDLQKKAEARRRNFEKDMRLIEPGLLQKFFHMLSGERAKTGDGKNGDNSGAPEQKHTPFTG